MSDIINLDEEIDRSMDRNLKDEVELSPEYKSLEEQKQVLVDAEDELEDRAKRSSNTISEILECFKQIVVELAIPSQPW